MDKTELTNAAEAARNGDRQAFEILYNEYRDKLYFFVKKNVGSTEAAEDIVSETFISAMEKISSLKSGEAFGSWLYSIAYNKSMTYLKRDSRYAHFETEEEQEAVIENAGLNEPVELPEDYAVNRQRQEELKRLIEDLKPDQRSAIMLYYYDQQSVSEVAESLGISETNAKQKLFAARKKIKEGIEKLYKNGGAFMAVPMGSMLESVMDSKSAAAARVAAAPVAGTASATGKIAGAAAAFVVAAGGLAAMILYGGSSKGQLEGDMRRQVNLVPDSSLVVVEEKTTETQTETTARTESASETNTSAVTEASSSSASTETETRRSTSSVTESTAVGTSAPVTTTAPRTTQPQTTTTPAPRVAEPVDMTVDRMVNSSVRELCELSANDFEVDYHNIYGVQGMSLGIKCASFPNYIFVANHDWVEGTPENEFEIADPNNPSYKFVIGNEIKLLNLMPGAVIDDGITVGMTYNELRSALGQDLLVYGTNDTRGFCAEALIKGREWSFVFDLTEEQEQEIQRRQQEMARGEELSIENSRGYAVDISDMNPTSKVAVLYVSY